MKLLLTIMGLISLIITSPAQSAFTIRGRTDNPHTVKIYLFLVNPVQADTTLVDSAAVTRQQFGFRKLFQEPKQAFLMVNDHSKKVSFLWDNQLHIQLTDEPLSRSSVTNSVATAEWDDFKAQIDSTYEREVNDFYSPERVARERPKNSTDYDSARAMNFIRTGMRLREIRLQQLAHFREGHPLSWVNLYLLCWYHRELGRTSVNRIITRLPTHLKESALYHQLDLALQKTN